MHEITSPVFDEVTIFPDKNIILSKKGYLIN